MILFNPLYATRDPFHLPQEDPIASPPPVPHVRSGLIRLDADDISITELLRKIAAAGGSNVLLSPGITGHMGVHFDGLPWQEALSAVIEEQGLQVKEHGAIIIISHNEALPRQIRIKARIVELSDQATQALGLELNQSFSDPSSLGPQVLRQSFALPSNTPGSFGINLGYLPLGFHLDLELALLETEGSARIISSPELLVLNHEEAWIHQGKELPYLIRTRGESSVFFKKAVLSLKVTPHVVDQHHTKILLEVNKDAVAPDYNGALGVPAIDTRQLATTVLVQNDQSIALGGIIELSEHQTHSAIPGFSWLFHHEEKRFEKKEVMVFLTVTQEQEFL